MYIYLYIYTHTHIHTHIYIHIHTYIYIYILSLQTTCINVETNSSHDAHVFLPLFTETVTLVSR